MHFLFRKQNRQYTTDDKLLKYKDLEKYQNLIKKTMIIFQIIQKVIPRENLQIFFYVTNKQVCSIPIFESIICCQIFLRIDSLQPESQNRFSLFLLTFFFYQQSRPYSCILHKCFDLVCILLHFHRSKLIFVTYNCTINILSFSLQSSQVLLKF